MHMRAQEQMSLPEDSCNSFEMFSDLNPCRPSDIVLVVLGVLKVANLG